MSKSVPRDLCWWFKMQYEVQFPQHTYVITGHDMRVAKEIVHANGEPDFALLQTYLPQYWKSDFWEEAGWPAYGFLGNLQRFKPRSRQESKAGALRIDCKACGQTHGIYDKCQVNA